MWIGFLRWSWFLLLMQMIQNYNMKNFWNLPTAGRNIIFWIIVRKIIILISSLVYILIEKSLIRPPLVKMLFIVIRTHWKWKIITAFNLIIFYCFTAVLDIRFFKYFSLYCLFLCRLRSFFKIFYLNLFRLLTKRFALSSTRTFDYQERYFDVLY